VLLCHKFNVRKEYVLWRLERKPVAADILIYKDECLFVCKFVPYTNPHFRTDWNHTLHTSPPWSGRDCRTCMNPQYLILFDIFVTCQEPVQNPGHNMVAPLLRNIRDAARAGVTSWTAVGCAMKTWRSEGNACL
jgi:hypothetical protein